MQHGSTTATAGAFQPADRVVSANHDATASRNRNIAAVSDAGRGILQSAHGTFRIGLPNRHPGVLENQREHYAADAEASHRQCIAAPSVVLAKGSPYLSRRRDAGLNLNGRVTRGEDGTEPYLCTDLAMLWIDSFVGEGLSKPDYMVMGNADALSAAMPANISLRYGSLSRLCQARISDHAGWGAVFAEQFREMRCEGTLTRALVIHSSNHLMAAGLKCKTKAGKSSFVLLFYDPNRTATHLRASFDRLDDVLALSAQHFLSSFFIAEYYPCGDATLFHTVTPTELSAMRSLTARPPPEAGKLAPSPLATTPALLCLLFSNNLIDALEALVPAILALPEPERFALLYRTEGIPMLHRVLFGGHVATLGLFRRMISGLPPSMCAQLFQQRGQDRTPALYIALTYKTPELLIPLFDLIREHAAGFSETIFVKDCIGTHNAVHVMCTRGNVDNFIALVRAMQHLPATARMSILTGYGEGSLTALGAALGNGHRRIVEAFGDALEGLDDFQRFQLLSLAATAARLDGALDGGHRDTVMAFRAVVEKHMPRDRRRTWLREIDDRLSMAREREQALGGKEGDGGRPPGPSSGDSKPFFTVLRTAIAALMGTQTDRVARPSDRADVSHAGKN